MRPAVLLGLAVLLAGCLTTTIEQRPADAGETPRRIMCRAPCEVAVDTGPGRAFEAMVARHPGQPSALVAVANRLTIGPTRVSSEEIVSIAENRWIDAYVSRDSGATWKSAPLPGGPTGGPAHPLFFCTDLTDPGVTILPNGDVLVSAIAGISSLGAFSLVVFRSVDGGWTYPYVSVVAAPEGLARPCVVHTRLTPQQHVVDKPWISSAPDGTVLLFWKEVRGNHIGLFASSMDGGSTWSKPHVVEPGGNGRFVNGLSGIMGADGTLYATMYDFGSETVRLARSQDMGRHWELTSVGPAAYSYPTLALRTSPTGETLLLGYAKSDGNPTARHAPAIKVSDDGGQSWSREYVAAPSQFSGASTPTLAVDRGGVAWSTFYRATSEDANELRVLAVDLDADSVFEMKLNDAPIGRQTLGLRLGHYMGIAANPWGATAVWVSGTSPYTDLRAASFRLEPGQP